MAATREGSLTLDLVGGYLCLDFANTVHNYRSASPIDELVIYSDLVVWAQRAGAITADDAQLLLSKAAEQPESAAGALERGKELRQLLFDVFFAITTGDEPGKRQMQALNTALVSAMGHARINTMSGGFEMGWAGEKNGFDRIFWPIIRSAANLLISDDLKKLRKCEAESCTWLFVDGTKNRSRRWCEMRVCGNRAKARRHYARRRQTQSD